MQSQLEKLYANTMEFIIHMISTPSGFFSFLLIDGVPRDTVAGTRESSFRHELNRPGLLHLAIGPKGKWSSSPAESIELVRKNVVKEVKRLESNGDLRPSQVRRLNILKAWLVGSHKETTTLEVR